LGGGLLKGCKNREKSLDKSIMRAENQGAGLGGGEAGKGGAKKRPSVETEGRLTIACHMKNLRKICFAGDHNIFTFLPPRCAHKFKSTLHFKKELNNIKRLKERGDFLI
jgi:hypothetical protein